MNARVLLRATLPLAFVLVGCVSTASPDEGVSESSAEPTEEIERPSADAVDESIVRIVAFGCGAPTVGTGFAVDADLIVTNAHIVAGRDTDSMAVQLLDGSEFAAALVGFDPDLDLAVLRVDGGNFQPLNLVTEVPITNGVAIGIRSLDQVNEINEVEFSVDAPVRVNWDGVFRDTESTFRGIRIDAEIRSGDSGSPLLINDQDVIGLIQSRTRGEPRGYAVRSSEILDFVNSVDTEVGVVADRCA